MAALYSIEDLSVISPQAPQAPSQGETTASSLWSMGRLPALSSRTKKDCTDGNVSRGSLTSSKLTPNTLPKVFTATVGAGSPAALPAIALNQCWGSTLRLVMTARCLMP